MLDSLSRRPRGRRAADILDRVRAAMPSAVPRPMWAEFPFLEREAPPGAPVGPVTRELLGRLGPEQRDGLEDRLPPQWRERWATLDGDGRDSYRLPLSLAFDVPGVADATGLTKAMPPHDIHAMAHGVEATGGTTYYADLVADALARAGAPLPQARRVLDFGCSSGRVVRVLAAWAPDVAFEGCDPNAPAIDWARRNLSGIRFFASPLRPPLDVPDGHYDAVFAISIWSHYAAEPALRWLAEMRRIVAPGGALLLTTHGYAAVRGFVAGDSSRGNRRGMARLVASLYTRGFDFLEVFAQDDWGVPADGWGQAFMTPEWLLPRVTPDWQVALYAPGHVEGMQDLYVLTRPAY